jgi:hypothetical protein
MYVNLKPRTYDCRVLKSPVINSGDAIYIQSSGLGSPVKVKDGMYLEADSIEIKTEGAGSSLDVRGSTLEADSTTITTTTSEENSSLIVKANTFFGFGCDFSGGRVTIEGKDSTQVTKNHFIDPCDLIIGGSGSILVYKNRCDGDCNIDAPLSAECRKNKPTIPPPTGPWPSPPCTP